MKNRIIALITLALGALVLVAGSCSDLENRLLGYRLEIISPKSGVVFRQEEPPAVPLRLQISGWEEHQIQEFPVYIHVNGVMNTEWRITGSRPAGAVTLTEPGKHVVEAVLLLDDGSRLTDSVTVTWINPSPLDKVAGAVTGLVVMGGTDPTTGYLLLFLIGEIALLLIGSSIGGGLGAQFFMLIGVAIAVVTLAQTPQGQSALWVILLGVLGYFFLRLMFNFRFFGWREDSGMAMGFTDDVAPAASQIAQRHTPQLPAPSRQVSLPSRTPGWVRLLRGGRNDE